MMRLAKIDNGKVVNVIISESRMDGYIECPDSVGPGWDYDGKVFSFDEPEREELLDEGMSIVEEIAELKQRITLLESKTP